jgi:hypothetical protein
LLEAMVMAIVRVPRFFVLAACLGSFGLAAACSKAPLQTGDGGPRGDAGTATEAGALDIRSGSDATTTQDVAAPNDVPGATDAQTEVADGRGAADAASDAGNVTDATTTTDTPTAADARMDATSDAPRLVGRRSYLLVAPDTPQVDGGASVPPTSTTLLTLVLDGASQTAILGSAAGGSIAPFTITPAGVIQIQQPFTLALSCEMRVTYTSLDLTLAADGTLLVAGQGQAIRFSGDVGMASPFTVSLIGVPDRVRPVLIGGSTDPFRSGTFVASEPLPVDSHPVLTSASGDRMVLSAIDGQMGVAWSFAPPSKLRRFGDTYRVSLAGVADFAGNLGHTDDDVVFKTDAAPPLITEDGFESVTATALGGAQVLSGGGTAVIAGAKSLYIPSSSGIGTPPPVQLALRLALTPGDRVLRFSYRVVTPSSFAFTQFLMASVGGTIVGFASSLTSSPTSTVTFPGGAQATVGPIVDAEFPLPTDASGELVIERVHSGAAGCRSQLPPPPVAGLIIDNLRAE